jgi:Mlc titration factor MtfA (ptsG expression regulator)
MITKGAIMTYYLLLLQLFFAIIALFLFWQSIGYFRRLWRYKRLKATPFPKNYEKILQNIHQYRTLPAELKSKLQLQILLFIDQKEFIGAKMTITDDIKVIIAFYANLMRLGFELFEKDDTNTIIVYPQHFIIDETRSNGGIHQDHTLILEGQSAKGTVVLSWQDIKQNIAYPQKENVIIHEFAHELDFEDGYADGTPILNGSSYRRWSEVFSKAFESLRTLYHKGDTTGGFELLGSYALKNEAEFFAVCSERFFETPNELKKYFPDIYEELTLFYRLNPITDLQYA